MIRFKTLPAVALAILLSACSAGNSQPTSFAPTRSGDAAATARLLHLNPPAAYCALDRSRPADALSLALLDQAVDGIAHVLAVWQSCPDLLASPRGIRRFDRPTAIVAAIVQNGAPVRAPMPRAALLPELAAAFEAISGERALDDALDAEARRRFDATIGRLAKSFGSHAALGEMTNLGVKAQDRNAVYLAMRSEASAGDQRLSFHTIVAITEINGLVIQVAVCANRSADPEMTRLLAFAQSLMAKLVAENDVRLQTDV